jgi:hypothetical protein
LNTSIPAPCDERSSRMQPLLPRAGWPLDILVNAAPGAGSSRQSLPNLQVVI